MDCLIPEISYTPIGPTSTRLYSSFDANRGYGATEKYSNKQRTGSA